MMQEKLVQMTNRQIKDAAQELANTMNAMHANGLTMDQVLMASCWAVGAAIAQRGGVLDMSAPLAEALSPLADGYLAMKKQQTS
jgi:hypothetical protein